MLNSCINAKNKEDILYQNNRSRYSAGFFPTTDHTLEDIMLHLVSCLLFQLLSVIAAGGGSCVEDQTDLLGFTAQRSKCHC